jgi:predicted restriction endonuclease
VEVWKCGSKGLGDFDFVNDVDSKSFKNLEHIEDDVIKVAIKTRRGQPAFRQALLTEYKGTCCITGCKIEAVLEAAHIIPNGDETNYSVYNGLLLRADVHTLFDLGLLRFNGAGVAHVDDTLNGSEYYQYEGHKLVEGRLPIELAQNLQKR